jgi:hypothetical protein
VKLCFENTIEDDSEWRQARKEMKANMPVDLEYQKKIEQYKRENYKYRNGRDGEEKSLDDQMKTR